MKIMFSIQGEGRGHLTQAMAVKEILEAAGHQVVCVVVGMSRRRQLPDYFTAAMQIPITLVPTLEFASRNNRSVSLWATILGVVRGLPSYMRSLRRFKAVVREAQPDAILNFFEPLAGLFALTCRKRPPVIALGHQFMLLRPDYVRAPGMWFQQLGLEIFVKLVGAGSTKLALSLYEAPNLPGRSIFVCPPLLRRRLFQLQPNPDGQFLLVYLLNHGYADQIIRWHGANRQVAIQCFYDKPDAPPEFRHDETLTFHRLDGEKFLRMMSECRHVVCTAGFESLCEAAYLGKPLFMVPVENHVEQQTNAVDAVQTGLGVSDRGFNLDRLKELPERLDKSRFRDWFARADQILLQTLEKVANSSRGT